MKTLLRCAICTFALTGIWLGVAHAGRVSIIVKGGKMALKAGAKEAAERMALKLVRQTEEKLARRYGKTALEKAGEFATKKGVPRESVLRLLADHGDVLARHHFSDEAIGFALKHRGPGIFFLRHPPLFDGLRKSVNLETVDPKVIVQAWRWGDEKAIGGSLQRLRDSLTKAGMKGGTERDFCEDLFTVKAASGKIPGIPKGTNLISGHVGDARQGIDRLWAQDGRIHAIEFGTGRKPGSGELDWNRIRNNLADFLEHQDTNARINLRAQGFPTELVTDPKKLRDPGFPIEKFVQREVYAPELDAGEIARLGSNVIAQRLN